jgi:SNF2 family DNA or RNA helicase
MTREFEPRPWQVPMIEHLLEHERCALFCPMGAGKSAATLTALDSLMLAGEDHPTLVLAPLRVARTTWPEEVRKWRHLRHVSVMPIVGSEAERRAALRYDASIFTVNYEQLEWLVEYYGERWPFRTVVADEMSKLKSFRLRQGGKRAAALAKVNHKIQRLIGLTGTPASNGLQDLWGQVWFIDQGKRLGRTFDAFKQRWFQRSFDGYGTTPLPHAQEQIQAALKDVCLTVDLKDYVDIAEPVVSNIYVDLPPRARRLYRDMEKEMFMKLEGHEVEAFNAAARTIKCLQLANGAAYVDDVGTWKEVHDEKLQALEDIVEEANGAPVLVAYHFQSDIARLRRAFPQGRLLDSDPLTIKEWNQGRIPILFAHPASAGHGLNLQDGGNILVYFGHWWNLEERMQILERIGPTRQMQAGHDRACYVYNLIARDTVDELVIERVNSKREVQDLLLEAMKRKGVEYA